MQAHPGFEIRGTNYLKLVQIGVGKRFSSGKVTLTTLDYSTSYYKISYCSNCDKENWRELRTQKQYYL